MRSLMLAASLLLLPSAASAACQCVCVGGQMRAVCPATDIVAPICQGLCGQVIQSERIGAPLAGGQQNSDASGSPLGANQGLAAGQNGRF